MKFIYLAGPYTHKSPEIQEARRKIFAYHAALIYLKEHCLIYDPINISAAMVDALPGKLGGTFKTWCEIDYECIRRCDEMYVICYPGLKESTGVNAEIKYAKSIGKTIKYMVGNINAENYEESLKESPDE